MKAKALFFALSVLLPIKLLAQTGIGLYSTYDAYSEMISINIVNTTDKIMNIRNDNGTGHGSLISFHIKDKADETISHYNVAFFETAEYQRVISINPHSTKTFKYKLNNLLPLTISTGVYTVDANCFIRYAIPGIQAWTSFNRTLSIKITKLDLKIYTYNDNQHYQDVKITLQNLINDEIIIRNSNSHAQFTFLSEKGEVLGNSSYSFVMGKTDRPATFNIKPHTVVDLQYQFTEISKNITRQSEITYIKVNCTVLYGIPTQNKTSCYTQKDYTIKIK